MSQKEILDYIKASLDNGYPEERITGELLKAGWEVGVVKEAFASVKNHVSNAPIKVSERQEEHEKKEPVPEQKSSQTQALETGNKSIAKKIIVNSKLKLALIIFLSVVIFGALASFVYARLQDTPDKVLEKSLLAMETVSAFDYNLEVKGEYQWKKGDFSDIMADPFVLLSDADSQIDDQILNPIKHQASLNIKGHSSTQVDNLDSKLDLSFWSDEMKEGEKIEIETRVLKEQAYIKLSLPSLDLIDLSPLENKWLKAPLQTEKIDMFSKLSAGEDSSVVVDNVSDLDSSSTEANISEKLSSEVNKLKATVIKNKPFTVIDTFSGALPSGQKTYHYVIEFDKAALERIFLEVQADEFEDQEQAVQELKEDMANIEIISGELVVGRDDFMLHNFSISISMKEGANKEDMLQILNLKIELSLQSFNQPSSVEEPKDSFLLQDVVGELLESFFMDSLGAESGGEYSLDDDWSEPGLIQNDEPGFDIERDSDDDSLTDYLELQIGTNPYNPDTDTDGYLDGEEYFNGYNPLGEGLLEDELVEKIVN